MSETSLKGVIEIRGKMEELQPSPSKIVGKVDSKNAIVLLKSLKNMSMTLEMLSESRIGMVVNDFRKEFPDKEVQALGKSLLKNWKKLLQSPSPSEADQVVEKECSSSPLELVEVVVEKSVKKRRKAHVPSSSSPGTLVKRLKIKEIRKPIKRNKTSEASSSYIDLSEEEEESQSPLTTPRDEESDAIRLKCRELLLNAVKGDGNYPDEHLDPQDLVEELEECIFRELKGTGFKYKSRIRSRVANLKDPRNPDLRIMFLEGRISPEKLSRMTAEEMASDELKSLRALFVKEAIDNAQLATVPGTKTELLKCGKCRKRNCVYNQLQTRSSDEPMTTFALCNDCGHRWKFN